MSITLKRPNIIELRPKITVFGVGGGGGNAVNNMINAGLEGVDFIVANTDAQALSMSRAEKVIQLGSSVTDGLGAGARPEIGREAAEECLDEIMDYLNDAHMVFVTAGMGGGTGTGAAPVIANAARQKGLLTVGVVTKPFDFEGQRRMRTAESGIEELQKCVDTLIVIPNQNLFRIANEKTTFADAFAMADQVLYSGVASITDLMIRKGLINLDFADVRSVMHDMGKAMMGTGEAQGENRALEAAEAAIANPLLDQTSMEGARGLLVSVSGGSDLTLFEVDKAINRIKEEVDADANIIFGAINDEALEGIIRVSVVATGIERHHGQMNNANEQNFESYVEKKFEEVAGQPQQLASVEANPINEVLEALKEEMAEPTEEPFRPQSQIFSKTNSPVHMSRATPTSSHKPAVQRTTVPLQPLGQTITSSMRSYYETENKIHPYSSQELDNASEGQQAYNNNVVKNTPFEHSKGDENKSRFPKIESFPENLQKNMQQNTQIKDQEFVGVRSLWQRLVQGLVHRDDDDAMARLEPMVAQQKTRDDEINEQNIPTSTIKSKAYVKNEATKRFDKTQPMSDEDKLEIPAFLRRQAN